MKIWLGATVCGMALCSAANATAQVNSAAGEAAPAEQVLETNEIVVTANKRVERIQDAPLAITAISGDELALRNAGGFAQYIATVPNAQFYQNEPSQSTLSIRGITTETNNFNYQDTVGVYVHDVPVSGDGGGFIKPDINPFDVSRIEVLRGPQGALYGSASLGGAVRLLYNDPDPTRVEGLFNANFEVTDRGDPSFGGQGMINAPLVQDVFAVRAVGGYRKRGGYVDNVGSPLPALPFAGKENANEFDQWYVRLGAEWRVAEGLTANARFVHQDDHTADQSAVFLDLGKYERTGSFLSTTTNRFTLANLEVNYEADAFAILSNSGFIRSTIDASIDRFDIYPTYSFLLAPAGPLSLNRASVVEQFSQEIRVQSVGDGPLNWLVGAFYSVSKGRTEAVITFDGISGFPVSEIYAQFFLGLLAPPPGTFGSNGLTPNDAAAAVNARNRSTQLAGFAELGYDFGNGFKIQAGARVSKNKIKILEFEPSGALFFSGGVLPTIDTVPEDSTVVTPKFTVAYKPNDNLNFYATAAKGYRLGDINAQGGLDPGQLTYGPDSLWNYEVGAKLGLLDDRLRIAAALYYIDWSNIQVIVTDLTTGSQFKSNEGSARSYGFEAEAILRPIDQLTISTAFNIGKAKITSGQFDGNRLPGAPRFQISNSVQYDFGRSEQSPTVRLEHIYVGSSFYNIENEPSVLGVPEPFAKVSGRHLVNARLTFPVSQRLSISAYAENLLNSSRITNVVDATANAYRQRPRTIGASFMASF